MLFAYTCNQLQFKYFFRLMRWQNLLIVGFTQFCAAYSFLHWPLADFLLSFKFYLTIGSTILITATGYIINDYLDVNIDQINKPSSVIIGTKISRKTAIKWHLALTGLALLSALLVSKWLFLIEFTTAAILVKYSSSLKKKFLIGNFTVAVLCGLLLPVMYLWSHLLSFKLLLVYGVFAGWITLIREIVKDAEDLKGDRMEGCKTIPIVLGLKQTKMIIYILSFLLILASVLYFILTSYIHFYSIKLEIGYLVYITLFVELPLCYIIYLVKHAQKTSDYSRISTFFKWVMLAGILSMVFFRL